MRNAALVLGIVGGTIGMIVGSFGYGWAEFGNWFVARAGVGADQLGTADERLEIEIVSLVAPILGIAGGSMARSHPVIGSALLAVSAVGMYRGSGFGLLTMSPIAMCRLAGSFCLIGVLTGRDENIP